MGVFARIMTGLATSGLLRSACARVSDATPRERRKLDPGACCPDCSGNLHVAGEDVSELLDMIAAQMKVIQIARIKKSCRRCERMGADIPESTLVGCCGRAMKALSPLIERIDADILGNDLLERSNTRIGVLDRSRRDEGLGRGVKQGRVWAYVRDQRPWREPRHLALSIGLHPTGKKSTF
jgi:transposase|tara:strand:- start:2192 stop:2734 length:543 start_codon:yes stop_codon:yes gene_type:complete